MYFSLLELAKQQLPSIANCNRAYHHVVMERKQEFYHISDEMIIETVVQPEMAIRDLAPTNTAANILKKYNRRWIMMSMNERFYLGDLVDEVTYRMRSPLKQDAIVEAIAIYAHKVAFNNCLCSEPNIHLYLAMNVDPMRTCKDFLMLMDRDDFGGYKKLVYEH